MAHEILELITARLKVIETARPKKSCRRCERIAQGEAEPNAPSRPIPREPWPGLPCWRISWRRSSTTIFPCMDRTRASPAWASPVVARTNGATTGDPSWLPARRGCGQGMRVLAPLVERIRADVLSSDRLHADGEPSRRHAFETDDEPDPCARSRQTDRGLGKGVKEGRIWTYLRDDWPWSGTAPPGGACFSSPGHRVAALELDAGHPDDAGRRLTGSRGPHRSVTNDVI
jgi:transposase